MTQDTKRHASSAQLQFSGAALALLPVEVIDGSPYQMRRSFPEEKLKQLAHSITRDGLIEPVVVRPKGDRYELIAGERRVRAVRDHTDQRTILSRLVDADDLRARRMCAAENLQRDDLSPVEAAEALVELIDAELIEDGEYAGMGSTSIARVKTLLGRLDSVRRSEEQGNKVKADAMKISHKFMGDLDAICASLPRPVEWRSFYVNDLPLVTDLDPTVREWAIANKLNKSQAKALQDVQQRAPKTFARLRQGAQEDGTVTLPATILPGFHDPDAAAEPVALRELSANDLRELRQREQFGVLSEQRLIRSTNTATPLSGQGTYRCLVIDPPWPMQKILREERPNQDAFDYPTMPLEEIRCLPIADLAAAAGCHIYLWATQKFLRDAFALFDAWGVAYQCLMTWVKSTGMTPYSWMYNTEHVLFGRIGNLPLERMGLKLSFEAPVVRHSQKPNVFYERVVAASPGPRLELFARTAREGFVVWGNEVPSPSAKEMADVD